MPGFEPKTKVDLDPPKDEPISSDYLAKCDGKNEGYPTYVAIKVSPLLPSAECWGDIAIHFPLAIPPYPPLV